MLFSPFDLSIIEDLYRSDIIHVGRADAALLRGKENLMQINIRPLAEMVNSGHVSISGRAYVVRRIVVGDMANDVGYLHMTITMPDGQSQEQLQKFSWVFLKSEGRWRVVTDFDSTPAPLSLIDELETQFIVENPPVQP